jgi:hypothetical protein
MADIDIVPFVLSIVGLGVALLLTLIACMYKISGKLSKIEDNTNIISDIRNDLTKLTERIGIAMSYGLQPSRGTIDLTLPNLGKVHVSAEPRDEATLYRIGFDKSSSVVNPAFIVRKSRETDLLDKEREIFGARRKEVEVDAVAHTLLILTVPSTDAQVCSGYVSLFLKWLDGMSLESRREIKEYEKIEV